MKETFICHAGEKVPYGGKCPKCGADEKGQCGLLPHKQAQEIADLRARLTELGALERERCARAIEAESVKVQPVSEISVSTGVQMGLKFAAQVIRSLPDASRQALKENKTK